PRRVVDSYRVRTRPRSARIGMTSSRKRRHWAGWPTLTLRPNHITSISQLGIRQSPPGWPPRHQGAGQRAAFRAAAAAPEYPERVRALRPRRAIRSGGRTPRLVSRFAPHATQVAQADGPGGWAGQRLSRLTTMPSWLLRAITTTASSAPGFSSRCGTKGGTKM